MICPKCESENCQFVSHSHTTSGSFCDGCCGFLLLGPVGILCGLCGRDTETKEFWVCNDCGCKFQRGLTKKTAPPKKTESPKKEKATTVTYTEGAVYGDDYNTGEKTCPECGKSLNAVGDCNFCGYRKK